MANLITDNRFPYYSHAFGCEVRDRSHLKRLEQRYGVHHCTEADIERKLARQVRMESEADERLQRDDEEYRNAHYHADFRRSIENGSAFQHLPVERQERARRQMLDKYCK